MTVVGPIVMAPSGSTGNNFHSTVLVDGSPFTVVAIVEAVGAAPTVTFTLQGSMDGVNWNTVSFQPSNTAQANPSANIVATGVGTNTMTGLPGMMFKYLRFAAQSNTNVTYRADLYLGR